MNVFQTEAISLRYPLTARDALSDVSVTVPRAGFTAVIGPNGSGKSTLLRVLLGALPPQSGSVHFQDRSVSDYTRLELARHVGVVTQIEDMPFPVTVRELVASGRYAHLGPWRAEGAADRAAVRHALERCDIAALADRSVNRISGGERQRARIARALAQEPQTLVLDEPTAALDVAHEMAVFELLRSLTSSGVTVLIATHNINHAARFADQLVLLDRGRLAAAGQPRAVMQRDVLQRVYGWPLDIYPHSGAGFDHGAPQIAPLSQLQPIKAHHE
ncbi:MAG TPA: ABC transporter ATP-binding protein [Longimicrobiales bacterium]